MPVKAVPIALIGPKLSGPPETVDVSALKTCDLWSAMRKFANPDIAKISHILQQEGAASLAELKEKTGLTTNVLNHDLIEMRKADLVIWRGRKYYITNYGALLVTAIAQIKKDIFEAPATELFKPALTPEEEKVEPAIMPTEEKALA